MAKKKTTQNAAKERIERTEGYAEQVRREYAQAVNSILALKKSLPKLDTGVMYSFDNDSKKMQKQVENILRNLHSTTLATIKAGVKAEWEQANKEVDELITSALGKKALSNPQLAGWFDRNEKAMDTFIKRRDNGMNLSDRIWKNTGQLREEMEVAMTVAIGEGNSASNMSRKVRQYLNDPDLMFRRFRYKDEDGEWQLKWKKRIKTENGKYRFIDYDRDSYKVGAGNYKSSYKNAMRVTRTETNMAYRNADHERWQQLDFVFGQRIETSDAHPKDDICDELAGEYPKDFVFEGWHPQCFCICTAIMASEEEMKARMDAALKGESYTFKQKPVTTYPKGFQKFLDDNETKIIEAQERGTAPYFIRDNEKVVERRFNGEDLTIKGIDTNHTERTLESGRKDEPKGASKSSIQTIQGNQIIQTSATSLSNISKNAASWGIEYREVEKLTSQITEGQIISKIGGGDKTEGACASLALAYAGNKCGYDVTDFRGGKSLKFFSNRLIEIARNVGGIIDEDYNGFTVAKRLLTQVKSNKEYIFTSGKHAAIVRRTNSHLEYLELQDRFYNGFVPLNNKELSNRFKCKKSHYLGKMKLPLRECLIDIDLLRNEVDFQDLLGYINTEIDKQKKGVMGSRK